MKRPSIHCRAAALALAVLSFLAGAGRAELRLAVLLQPGCAYCLQWEREIAPAYPHTPEGQAAPLWRLDIRDPLPGGVSLARPGALTPSFVLLEDGVETGRIEGYPGAEFFWGLLGRLIAEADDV
ncbi:thioredoxin family protein [Poseidonocella sp. HB161398]|uniref:thioredoxin family protein n=1 Tax=Poseidonocella sp. HB161398 TaxID=2320855 RepID=UPI001109F8B6|nr:thioredoxin family protein [Poseidonocella sp. HB161398]